MLTTVIPVYNVESYLEKCIESVINQSYRDMEILLINDGSTDKSGCICKKFESIDSRIRYIEKKNEGSGETRNLGIKLAKGEYITFLDSDDWWHRDYAEKMMRYADVADIIICDMCYIDIINGEEHERVSKIRMPDRIVLNTEGYTDYINRGRTFLCGKVFRKELFFKYNIWQPTMAINDIPIVPVLIALSKNICHVGESLYYYLRTRDGNTISSVSSLKSFGDALVKMNKNFERFGLLQKYEKALKKMYYSQVRFAFRKAKNAYKLGKLDEQNYYDVTNFLCNIIQSFWPDWPNIDGKRFRRSKDNDINHAIENILFDDEMLTNIGPFSYSVFEKNTKLDYGNEKAEFMGNIIEITKYRELEGEDLWWLMADELLFRL